ncbi:hypothetical protein EU96_1005 [Prochlorococcus marinus str. MIT 9302]|uniref:Uncharacterized protein n=1 Tax=Prochlorococcus marinus str. MIT 9302 TaxID=74545 RepID=A0A0A2AA39_PROMR|nr:hypothetical protein EU96_1005 [Prochlorococcus marinus str. MIT 9302]
MWPSNQITNVKVPFYVLKDTKKLDKYTKFNLLIQYYVINNLYFFISNSFFRSYF